MGREEQKRRRRKKLFNPLDCTKTNFNKRKQNVFKTFFWGEAGVILERISMHLFFETRAKLNVQKSPLSESSLIPVYKLEYSNTLFFSFVRIFDFSLVLLPLYLPDSRIIAFQRHRAGIVLSTRTNKYFCLGNYQNNFFLSRFFFLNEHRSLFSFSQPCKTYHQQQDGHSWECNDLLEFRQDSWQESGKWLCSSSGSIQPFC